MDIGLKVVLICAGFMAICVVLGMIGEARRIVSHRQRHVLGNKRLSAPAAAFAAFPPGQRNRAFSPFPRRAAR